MTGIELAVLSFCFELCVIWIRSSHNKRHAKDGEEKREKVTQTHAERMQPRETHKAFFANKCGGATKPFHRVFNNK